MGGMLTAGTNDSDEATLNHTGAFAVAGFMSCMASSVRAHPSACNAGQKGAVRTTTAPPDRHPMTIPMKVKMGASCSRAILCQRVGECEFGGYR